MAATLRSKLAPIYQAVLPAFFDRPAIEETRATCDDCAMCDKTAPAGVQTTHFDPETKCCTYHPSLPNYLVGAVFADPSPDLEEGRRRLRAKLAHRIGVTPRWLAAPRKFLVHLEASRYWAFGRAKSMKCPYYDDGRCSIWHHRETVCSTFFCKYEGAQYGWAFWDAMKQYMFRVESALTQYAIRTVGPDTTEPTIGRLKMTLEDVEDRPPPEAEYARYWGSWLGREEAFYIACHEAVSSLDAARVAEILDATPRAKELSSEMEEKYDALTKPKLHERLVRNRKLEVVPATGGVVVTSYSRYDPFFMSEALAQVVDGFREDEPVRETLARLKRDEGLDVPEELVMRLQMLDVVVPPSPSNDGEKSD
ncbi:MAG: hypothetical protein HOW73_17655 [Polyangiaceae bacterium]|nr:hypothetical protein [Polyangiaceae bacterium]